MKNGNRKTKTRTRLCGNHAKYSPRTPEIAPDAPTDGIPEPQRSTVSPSVAATPVPR